MGLVHELLGGVVRDALSINDAPGLPPGIGPAIDAIGSGRDPTIDDVMETIIDMAGGPRDVPFFGKDLAKEAYKEGKKNVGKAKKRRDEQWDESRKSKYGNPDI